MESGNWTFEAECDEIVEHDVVLEIGPGGEMIDRTEGDYDPKVREQQQQ